MPLFMDVHRLDGAVSADDVAKAHMADLQTQGKYDVKYLRYWVDGWGTKADLWVNRAGSSDHISLTGTDVHEIVWNGTTDEHYTLRAAIGDAVTNWDIHGSTEGGCHLSITETTGSY